MLDPLGRGRTYGRRGQGARPRRADCATGSGAAAGTTRRGLRGGRPGATRDRPVVRELRRRGPRRLGRRGRRRAGRPRPPVAGLGGAPGRAAAGGRGTSRPADSRALGAERGRGRWSAAARPTSRAARSGRGRRGRRRHPARRSARRWSPSPRTSTGPGSTCSPRTPRSARTTPPTAARWRAPGFQRHPGDPAVAPPDGARARRPTATRARVFDGIAKATRQRIRRAERDGVVVAALGRARPRRSRASTPATEDGPRPTPRPASTTLLRATGERRGLRLRRPRRVRRVVAARACRRPPRLPRGARGPATAALSSAGWSSTATGAGCPRPTPPTAPSAAATHPGTMHLLRWRAIQLALAEGRDGDGPRRAWTWRARGATPEPGEPTYGLYEHKRSFGATWVELAGAQERVARPWRYAGRPRRRGRACAAGGAAVTRPARDRSSALVAAAGPAGSHARSAGCSTRLAPPAWCAARVATVARRHRQRWATWRCPASPRTRARVRPADACSSPCPGSTWTATTSSRARRAAGAAAALVERAVPGVAHRRSSSCATPGRRSPAPPRWWYGDPSRRLGVVGRHRHRRQDHHLVPRRGRARGGRHRDRAHRHGRDARWAGSASATRRTSRPRAPRSSRRRSRAMAAAGDAAAVVETTSHAPRAGPGARRSPTTRRSSRTSPTSTSSSTGRSSGTARPSCACSSALAAGPANPAKTVGGRRWPKARHRQPGRPGRALVRGGGRATPAPRSSPTATGPTPMSGPPAVEEDARRLRVAFTRAVRVPGRSSCGWPAASTSTTRWRWSRSARRWAWTRPRGPRRAGGRRRACRAGWSGSTPGQPFGVIVDYAHSPGLARRACWTSSRRSPRRGGGGLIAVFGSAGERDTAKRAVMGRIAGERCRLVVATDEDPRGEDRVAIVDGDRRRRRRRRAATAGEDVLGIPDRRTAIAAAFERAPPGRRRAARRQGPRADDPVRGRRDPVGRGRGRPRGPRRDGLRRRLRRCAAACSRSLLAAVVIALAVFVGLPAVAAGAADRRASRRRACRPNDIDRHRHQRPAHGPARPPAPTASGSAPPTPRSGACRSARSTSRSWTCRVLGRTAGRRRRPPDGRDGPQRRPASRSASPSVTLAGGGNDGHREHDHRRGRRAGARGGGGRLESRARACRRRPCT